LSIASISWAALEADIAASMAARGNANEINRFLRTLAFIPEQNLRDGNEDDSMRQEKFNRQ
jgi:hypothetical protein